MKQVPGTNLSAHILCMLEHRIKVSFVFLELTRLLQKRKNVQKKVTQQKGLIWEANVYLEVKL